MASFNGFILTNKGCELLAKAVAGEQLTFTKMEVGDGTFTGDIKTLTALVNKKDDFNINQITNQGNGQVVLKAIINNQSTVTGYYIREIGVFAHGADNIEILYAYNKAIEADYFPAFNGSNAVEFEYQNIIIVDQAQNITAVIDPSLTYVTKDEAEIRILESLGYLVGGQYDGMFGVGLTSITKDKIYIYIDSNGKGTTYVALQNNTNPAGFLSPDTTNFDNVTNVKLKGNGKKANYTALRGLVLDSDIFEVVSSTAGLLFTVRVKKSGTYNLSSTVFANFTENALVRILTYLNSTLYLSIRNTANYKSTTAGLDLSEQMVMPSITIDAAENDNLSIQVTGTTSVGSEWGFFITKVR